MDLGSDIGIQACFYAIRFPASQVVGIDRCVKSIQCAKQLAAKLNVKNVEFVQADFNGLPDELENQEFDMVVSSFVAHYLGNRVLGLTRSVEEAEHQQRDPGLAKYARLISALLRDENSLYLNVQRMLGPIVLADWIWCFRMPGSPSAVAKEMLEFQDEQHKPIKALVVGGPCRTPAH